jgi:hypothetical protein
VIAPTTNNNNNHRYRKMSPLLLVLDGVLSQDADRVAEALQEIAGVLPAAAALPVGILTPSDLMIMMSAAAAADAADADSSSPSSSPSPSSSDALLNLVRALLEASPDLAGLPSTHDGSLPLHFAASLGDVRVASLLLDYVSS